MSLWRERDGRYAIHHRVKGYGRRVFRSESWDFANWTGESRMVLEPDAGDPPQVQFYGMGAAPYGSYLIGTLWVFHTDLSDVKPGKSNGFQECELTYARNGYAWHRAAQGVPFIPHGEPGTWEEGNLQCASQPVLLDDEIRYYYMGTTMRHQRHWELEPQTAGIGFASIKPDRFIALRAGDQVAELLTTVFVLRSPDVLINARTEADGWVKLELCDQEMRSIAALAADDCRPIAGDSTAHAVRWQDSTALAAHVGKPVRVRLTARRARVYSVYVTEPDETPVYHRFDVPRP